MNPAAMTIISPRRFEPTSDTSVLKSSTLPTELLGLGTILNERDFYKSCLKRRKSWLPAVSSFQTPFSAFLNLNPYSLTTLKNVLSIILQIFLYLAAFECNTTFDWLNHVV